MNFYLDASAIVPLILRDAHTERMSAWIAEPRGDIFVSDFAALEFLSVVARQILQELHGSFLVRRVLEHTAA